MRKVMTYLANAFAAGEVSFIVFTQAFDGANADDVREFYEDLDGEGADGKSAFDVILASTGYGLPPRPATE